MAEYEQRKIGNSTYTVPKGTSSTWKPGQAYSTPASTAKPATTTTTATKTTTSAPSSLNSTYKSPSSGGVDTSGLSGYALDYANAVNSGNIDFSGLNATTQQVATTPSFDYHKFVKQYMDMLPSAPEPEPTLTYDQGKTQATDFYTPMYGQLMNRALDQVDENNIRRGFFGQMPGAALARSTAADVENQKAQAIGQLANQMVGQSQNYATALQQSAQQQYNTQANALMQALASAINYDNNQQLSWINAFRALNEKQNAERDDERDLLPYLYHGSGGGY